MSHLLLQTAHFFLSIIYRTSDNTATTVPIMVQIDDKTAEVTMYQSSLQEKFPARAIHSPPIRSRGMTRQPSFNRTPPSRKENVKISTSTVVFRTHILYHKPQINTRYREQQFTICSYFFFHTHKKDGIRRPFSVISFTSTNSPQCTWPHPLPGFLRIHRSICHGTSRYTPCPGDRSIPPPRSFPPW